MPRSIQAGLILAAASTAVWVILLLVFVYAPALNIKFYPSVTVPLATVAPFILARPLAKHIIRRELKALTGREIFTLSALSIGLCATSAFVIEAGIAHSLLSQVQPVSLIEVLSEPLSNRYSLTVLFGLSFFSSTLLVCAFVSLISIPSMVHARIRRQVSKTAD
jgi:hypothetical protein